jgi:hypothetical protein
MKNPEDMTELELLKYEEDLHEYYDLLSEYYTD